MIIVEEGLEGMKMVEDENVDNRLGGGEGDDKRGCEGVVGTKLISECLSHDQALSNIQHRFGNDTTVSVLYTSLPLRDTNL